MRPTSTPISWNVKAVGRSFEQAFSASLWKKSKNGLATTGKAALMMAAANPPTTVFTDFHRTLTCTPDVTEGCVAFLQAVLFSVPRCFANM